MKKPIEVPCGYRVFRDDTGWVCEHVSGETFYARTLSQALLGCMARVANVMATEGD
jgi:hypothetical protein